LLPTPLSRRSDEVSLSTIETGRGSTVPDLNGSPATAVVGAKVTILVVVDALF
jgi:hypothetical protein|tara:strand:- start:177 stop:335 length:159 start_codon:yes stop_codon:yes gene_type:complete